MDLVKLLAHVPPLLEACISVQITAVRTLRLVCKEASGTALLGLRSYKLRLLNNSAKIMDMNVNGARLLRTTQLNSLQVCLTLTGRCLLAWGPRLASISESGSSIADCEIQSMFFCLTMLGHLRTSTDLNLKHDLVLEQAQCCKVVHQCWCMLSQHVADLNSDAQWKPAPTWTMLCS